MLESIIFKFHNYEVELTKLKDKLWEHSDCSENQKLNPDFLKELYQLIRNDYPDKFGFP